MVVSKTIPFAERKIEFESEENRTNFAITCSSEELISEREWEKFAENALVMIDGWDILQYAEEYPIVKYQCDKVKCCALQGELRLNSFIESISVSTASYGKRVSVGTGRVSSEITDNDTVVYYTDHAGINHAVIQNDVYKFLLQKPNLVISPEGVLVFYTDKQIIATVDLYHYHWIDRDLIDVGDKTIKDIEVYEKFCKVILEDSPYTDNLEKFLKNEREDSIYKLWFDFNMDEFQMISVKCEKV